jgi:membrane associated rhomboid family serine protease
MIPLKDNIRPQRRPIVNYALIAVTALVFLFQMGQDEQSGHGIITSFGMIPKRVVDPQAPLYVDAIKTTRTGFQVRTKVELEPGPIHPWLTILTCIFLHGGWMHFLGNMWFLYIFGDNVEDRLGRPGYLIFYLATGAAASLSQLAVSPSSTIPTVGASGAIAGVMGGYLLLFPRATVLTLIPFVFLHIINVSAWVFLFVWFGFQFFQGSLSFASMDSNDGGVAWWAHIGGFVAGAAAIVALRKIGVLRKHPVVARSRVTTGRRRYARAPRRRY